MARRIAFYSTLFRNGVTGAFPHRRDISRTLTDQVMCRANLYLGKRRSDNDDTELTTLSPDLARVDMKLVMKDIPSMILQWRGLV